jgi:transposase
VNAHNPTDVVIEESVSINAQSTIALLKKLERKNPTIKKIYVVADNARYYRNRLVREFLKTSKVTILFLPPYSPNLNLIERLWRFLKKTVLYNTYYEKFADFRNAILNFLKKNKALQSRACISHDPSIPHSRCLGFIYLLRRNLASHFAPSGAPWDKSPRLRSPSYSHSFLFQK